MRNIHDNMRRGFASVSELGGGVNILGRARKRANKTYFEVIIMSPIDTGKPG
jgi:hypothetical protein